MHVRLCPHSLFKSSKAISHEAQEWDLCTALAAHVEGSSPLFGTPSCGLLLLLLLLVSGLAPYALQLLYSKGARCKLLLFLQGNAAT